MYSSTLWPAGDWHHTSLVCLPNPSPMQSAKHCSLFFVFVYGIAVVFICVVVVCGIAVVFVCVVVVWGIVVVFACVVVVVVCGFTVVFVAGFVVAVIFRCCCFCC